nr:hypothetical protein [Tanacetum cinerariifolium]
MIHLSQEVTYLEVMRTLDKENVSKQGRDESNRTEELNLFDKGSGETEVFNYTTTAEKDAAEPVFTVGDAVNAASVILDVSTAGPSTMIHDVEEEPRRATPSPTVKKPRQRLFEEEQAQFEREQRIAREKATEQEAKDAALIKQMKDILYEKEQKWINDFVPMDFKEVNDSEQQAEELAEASSLSLVMIAHSTKELYKRHCPSSLTRYCWIGYLASLWTSVKPVEHPTQAKNLRKDIPKSRGHKHSRNKKACFVCKSLNHLIKDCDFYKNQMVQKPMRNHAIKDKDVIDSGCSGYMTGNISYLFDFEEINGGYIAFGGNPKGGKITGKGNPQQALKDKDVIDSEINGGYIAFGGNPKGGKITGKLCGMKGIKRSLVLLELLNRIELQERNNRTLIEAARTMLADSLLPILFWAEAVNTTCYVQNRVLVTNPYNKITYELLLGRTPSIGFMRPFGCLVTSLNTLDSLGKFDGKADEGFLVGYPVSSKAFRVFNRSQPNHNAGIQANLDAGSQPNHNAGIQANLDAAADAAFDVKDNEPEVFVSPSSSDTPKKHDEKAKREAKGKSLVDLSTGVRDLSNEFEEVFVNSTHRVNAASAPVTTVRPTSTNSTNSFNTIDPFDIAVSSTFEIGDVDAKADFSNLETSITVSPIPTTRFYKDHPVTQIIEEPKRVHQALKDLSWSEAMQEELLQFKMQKVWVLVDLPKGKRAIGLKWVFRNKKDERGIVIRNKARLVAQGHTQEEGIDYEEVFTPVARIKAIWLLLAYAFFIGFMVYKVVKALYGLYQALRAWYETLVNYLLKNGFHRGKIDQTLFIKKQKGDIFLVWVYVYDIIFGSTNKKLLKQKDDVIFVNQDKYVAKILRKFGLTDGKLASTPIDTEKPLLQDRDGEDVDVHIYRYLKGKPHLGLWYLKDSPFNLVAYSDSDYAGASLDRKFTIG